MRAAEGYMALFAGEQTVEAKAAALRLARGIEFYISRCEAEAKAARERKGAR